MSAAIDSKQIFFLDAPSLMTLCGNYKDAPVRMALLGMTWTQKALLKFRTCSLN